MHSDDISDNTNDVISENEDGNDDGKEDQRSKRVTFTEFEEARLSEFREDGNADMYTPGICVSLPDIPHRKNNSVSRLRDRRIGSNGAIIKTACLVLVCALISGVVAFGVMEYRILRGDFPIITQIVLSGTDENAGVQQRQGVVPVAASTGMEMAPEDIYEMARHHVVGIATGNIETRSFFGQGDPAAVNGSGFFISGDGHILTNFHVIETAHISGRTIIVHLEGGMTHEASVIGYESRNDVAVIKIEAEGLRAATIANSDSVRVGQRLYTVGNPFGTLVQTMTEGIVSALDRVVTVDRKIINTFQLSAAVNSGNSGGPVYDARGEVIGMVTAKFRNTEIEGVGFAIPINDAMVIAESLIEYGYITGRPFIGIGPLTVTRGNAEYFGWVEGVYVRTITPDSAAEKAGLMFGDIITKLGEDVVTTINSLEFAMRKHSAGDTTTITVWRSGDEVELAITFDEAKD